MGPMPGRPRQYLEGECQQPLPPQSPNRTDTLPSHRRTTGAERSGEAKGQVTHFRRCPATEGWAVSCPWYMASEAQHVMAWCIRYCTVSILTTAEPCFSARRSIRLRDNPASAALCPRRKNKNKRVLSPDVTPWEGRENCPQSQDPGPPHLST